jgi:hypothetical protein
MSLSIVRSRVGFTFAPDVAKATVPLGLPEASLPLLLEGLASGNTSTLMSVPGINPKILQAAVIATKDVYANAYR